MEQENTNKIERVKLPVCQRLPFRYKIMFLIIIIMAFFIGMVSTHINNIYLVFLIINFIILIVDYIRSLSIQISKAYYKGAVDIIDFIEENERKEYNKRRS